MVIFIIILLVVAAIIFFKLKSDPKWLKEIYEGKDDEQKEVIRYFLREGCLASVMKDAEYDELLAGKIASINPKQKALDKHGLDIEQVNEIPPVNFEGYVFDDSAYVKKGEDDKWRSSKYQISWIFFSDTQVYFYQYTFNTDELSKREATDEYFYKDIVNFSTSSTSEEVKLYDKSGKSQLKTVDTDKFQMVVPGDKVSCSMTKTAETDNIIKAMKNKLREKKN